MTRATIARRIAYRSTQEAVRALVQADALSRESFEAIRKAQDVLRREIAASEAEMTKADAASHRDAGRPTNPHH